MNMNYVARKLRFYRTERGFTVHQLSSASGVSVRQIEKIEGEEVGVVHTLILEKLADALLVRLEDILDNSPPPTPAPQVPSALRGVADAISLMIALLAFTACCAIIATIVAEIL